MLFKSDYKKLNVWIGNDMVKFNNYLYETKDKEEISVLSTISGVVQVDERSTKTE